MNAGGLLYSLVPVLLYCYAVYMYISVVYVCIPVSSLTFLFRKGVVANPRSAVASLAVARAQRCTHFAVVAVRVSHPPETMNTEESTARSAAGLGRSRCAQSASVLHIVAVEVAEWSKERQPVRGQQLRSRAGAAPRSAGTVCVRTGRRGRATQVPWRERLGSALGCGAWRQCDWSCKSRGRAGS